jgi:hypothetical protein
MIMSYKALMCALAAVPLVGAVISVDMIRDRRDGPVFISSN